MHGVNDLALLRAYEPIIAFTKGESFFPTDVAGYVGRCGLWRRRPDGKSEQIAVEGELTLDRLAGLARVNSGADLYLVFVDQPLGRREVRRRYRAARPPIARTGRLAAVGLMARIVDLLMRISLLIRGSVPGGVAAAAAERYREMMDPERYTYYGRVLRDGGYVILQYWYFYAMNDWRSNFGGINDHEADWETVSVYLTESELRPAWVAYSSHDHKGDDLRRRWDDPDLRREGDHPVVLAGAGSHSGAMLPGDYLVRVTPPKTRRAIAALQRVSRLVAPWTRARQLPGIGIPFIDYARGNGITVGPGGDHGWQLIPIDDDTDWVHDFRGLWGRDTRDPLGGERAPAGPRYERDGRVRTSWADPLGWSGLQKVEADPAEQVVALTARIDRLDEEISALDTEVAVRRGELRALRATADSLGRHVGTRAQSRERRGQVAEAERALARLYQARSRLAEERTAHREFLAHPPAPQPPQAHLIQVPLPYKISHRHRTRFLTAWAAASTSLFMLSLAVILLLPVHGFIPILGGLFVAFLAIEAVARRHLLVFIIGLITLAAGTVLAVLILIVLWQNWRIALAAPLAATALILLTINLRDLLRR